MFKFRAILSTDDGRLTKNKIYRGGFVSKYSAGRLRIVVWDNKDQWMTFDPKVFEPVED